MPPCRPRACSPRYRCRCPCLSAAPTPSRRRASPPSSSLAYGDASARESDPPTTGRSGLNPVTEPFEGDGVVTALRYDEAGVAQELGHTDDRWSSLESSGCGR